LGKNVSLLNAKVFFDFSKDLGKARRRPKNLFNDTQMGCINNLSVNFESSKT